VLAALSGALFFRLRRGHDLLRPNVTPPAGASAFLHPGLRSFPRADRRRGWLHYRWPSRIAPHRFASCSTATLVGRAPERPACSTLPGSTFVNRLAAWSLAAACSSQPVACSAAVPEIGDPPENPVCCRRPRPIGYRTVVSSHHASCLAAGGGRLSGALLLALCRARPIPWEQQRFPRIMVDILADGGDRGMARSFTARVLGSVLLVFSPRTTCRTCSAVRQQCPAWVGVPADSPSPVPTHQP